MTKNEIFEIFLFSESQQVEAVYRFSFDVNPTDVVDLDARLGDCILHEPLKATALFQSVSFRQGGSSQAVITSFKKEFQPFFRKGQNNSVVEM